MPNNSSSSNNNRPSSQGRQSRDATPTSTPNNSSSSRPSSQGRQTPQSQNRLQRRGRGQGLGQGSHPGPRGSAHSSPDNGGGGRQRSLVSLTPPPSHVQQEGGRDETRPGPSQAHGERGHKVVQKKAKHRYRCSRLGENFSLEKTKVQKPALKFFRRQRTLEESGIFVTKATSKRNKDKKKAKKAKVR